MKQLLKTATSLMTFFKGGVHLNEHKELTQFHPIRNYNNPHRVQLHLSQHMGPPSRPIVKRGDFVKRGQMIAEAVGDGVPVHASIGGKVVNIGRVNHPILVEGEAIIIEAQDPGSPDAKILEESEELPFPEDLQWRNLSGDEMLRRIRDGGLVGLGGATFPTYRKLSLPPQNKVDTLILNGAECEPYLTTDHRLMLEKGLEILMGAGIMCRILGVSKCLVGIEDNKKDAAENLKILFEKIRPQWDKLDLKVHITRTRYPQGSEKQLIQALTGRNVPARRLPMDVGVVVQNVATALATYEAVAFKKPLLDTVLTISGLGIHTPKNVRVPIGTSLNEIVAFCGGTQGEVVKVIHGGPMMGKTLATVDIPILKGSSGFLFLTEAETYLGSYQPCIHCGQCLEVCPLGLEPQRISNLVEAGQPLKTEEFGTHECFECGCCSFACPSKRPLVQFIQVAKQAYRKDRQQKGVKL